MKTTPRVRALGDRGGHKNRISKESRDEITRLYHYVPPEAAVEFGLKLGLSKKYILDVAHLRSLFI